MHLKWTEGQIADYVVWISPCCSDKTLGTRKKYKLRYQEQLNFINLIYLLSFGSKLFALRSMLCLPAPHRVWCLTMRRGRGSETHLGLSVSSQLCCFLWSTSTTNIQTTAGLHSPASLDFVCPRLWDIIQVVDWANCLFGVSVYLRSHPVTFVNLIIIFWRNNPVSWKFHKHQSIEISL